MGIQPWPFRMNVYIGEGRILIIPVIKHTAGFSVDSDWFVNIKDIENAMEIGKGLVDAIKVISESPVSTKDTQEVGEIWAWQKNSKYKSWVSFWRKNYCVRVKYYEDGRYEIYSLVNSSVRKGVYSEIAKTIVLEAEAEVEKIGNAVIEVFEALEEHISERIFDKERVVLLDGSQLSFIPPKDRHFTDDEDAGAAEIYQCYSYHSQEDAESSAEFFIGIAPELDCNLAAENIRTSWENIYGKSEFFEMQELEGGLFRCRAEMRNKNSHRISYLVQQEVDLLLECGMDVHQPARRKKLDEKLVKMFEEFAMSCRR